MRANTLVIFVLHLTSTKKATSGKFAPKPHVGENVVKDPTQTAGAQTCKHFGRIRFLPVPGGHKKNTKS